MATPYPTPQPPPPSHPTPSKDTLFPTINPPPPPPPSSDPTPSNDTPSDSLSSSSRGDEETPLTPPARSQATAATTSSSTPAPAPAPQKEEEEEEEELDDYLGASLVSHVLCSVAVLVVFVTPNWLRYRSGDGWWRGEEGGGGGEGGVDDVLRARTLVSQVLLSLAFALTLIGVGLSSARNCCRILRSSDPFAIFVTFCISLGGGVGVTGGAVMASLRPLLTEDPVLWHVRYGLGLYVSAITHSLLTLLGLGLTLAQFIYPRRFSGRLAPELLIPGSTLPSSTSGGESSSSAGPSNAAAGASGPPDASGVQMLSFSRDFLSRYCCQCCAPGSLPSRKTVPRNTRDTEDSSPGIRGNKGTEDSFLGTRGNKGTEDSSLGTRGNKGTEDSSPEYEGTRGQKTVPRNTREQGDRRQFPRNTGEQGDRRQFPRNTGEQEDRRQFPRNTGEQGDRRQFPRNTGEQGDSEDTSKLV
ncbi:hypothetical protein ACOMHN_052490 [Nucella lapillus]